MTSGRGLILLYHRVNRLASDTFELAVPPAIFAAQMRYLREAFAPMSLEALARAAVRGEVPERAVAVTFDDGYLDNLASASPILVELGIPATFFINTFRVGEAREFWWDLLEGAMLEAKDMPGELRMDLGQGEIALATRTPAERLSAFRAVHGACMPLSQPRRDELVARVLRFCGGPRPARESHRAMLPDELRQLGRMPGHTLGAHTTNHLLLPAQPAVEQRAEMLESKHTLEKLCGAPIATFSYPFGACDATSVTLARECGFTAAVTVTSAPVEAGADPMLLPRVDVKAWEEPAFAARLARVLRSR
jgi:peptidoglycan/xylan/chitin deacetylase (PgdA/CDA1 family)